MVHSKLSRRHFLQLAGSTVGVAALAACAPPSTAPSGGDGDGGGATQETDRLWFVIAKDFHPGYDAYVRAEVTAYAEEQGLELELVDAAGFAAGSGEVEKLAAAVQAGDPPDLALHTFTSTQVQNLGIVEPVTDLVDQVQEVFGDVAPFLKQSKVIEGEWWAVPYHQRSGGGYYRRDVFDGVGIDLQEIRQYEDLREAALEASNPDEEIYGWGITVNRSGDGNSIINRIKTAYGAGWQDETGQFIRTNSPEMIDAMTFLKETYTDEKWAAMLPPGVLAWNDISNNEAYLGGKLAYTENGGTVFAKAIIDENPVAELTNYLKPPGGPVNQEFQAIPSKDWYLMKGAPNADNARQLIIDFTTDLARVDGMLASSPAYAIPAYTDLWEQSEFTQGFEPALQQKSAALDSSGIDAGPWPGPPSPAIDAIFESGTFNDMVNSIVTGTSVEDAVATAHDRMVLIFKEFGLPGEE